MRPEPERIVQRAFSKSVLCVGLLLAGAVVASHRLFTRLPDREQRADASAPIRFTPVAIGAAAASPLRVAGAWRLTSTEPRLGGISALSIDRGGLLALTDSGVTIRFPKPKRDAGLQLAQFHDLPEGPGGPRFKSGRDSEGLAHDAAGRGWWVTFENHHSAWLFDGDFKRVERRIRLDGLGWSANQGAEGAVSLATGLLLFPERGDELVRVAGRGVERIRLANPYRRVSDVAVLADGRVMVFARSFSPAGFSGRLLILDGTRLRPVAVLRLGRLDNPEAIAAEALPGGGTRLWVMTDNDFRRRVPTLLIALDWAG